MTTIEFSSNRTLQIHFMFSAAEDQMNVFQFKILISNELRGTIAQRYPVPVVEFSFMNRRLMKQLRSTIVIPTLQWKQLIAPILCCMIFSWAAPEANQ